MKVEQPPDPWQRTTTANGFAADEVISALQKSIRRGMLENAVLLAWEMFATSPEMEVKLWSRPCVTAVEDVGLGDPQMPVLVETLFRQHALFERGEGDRFLFAAHAVRLLCLAPKDGTSDDLSNWARHATVLGERRPDIFDAALDMHTGRGQAMGRDYRFFMEDASRVANESGARDPTWRNWILAALDDGRLR